MTHPFSQYRQSKVERSRVGTLTKGYAAGGSVQPATTVSRPTKETGGAALAIEGRKSGGRLDKFARGGGVKKGSTNVNVIIAPQGGAAPPMAPPVPPLAAGPPMPPPKPPMMPPGGAPMMQRHGGRAYAKGGAVADGPAWKEGLRNGTQVQHTDGKNDGADIYRGRQITYAKGGRTYPINDGSGSGPGRLEKIGKTP